MSEVLPGKRLEVLRLLARRVRSGERGGPPSVREICEAVGLRSKQTVHHHLTRLESEGYIQRLDDRHRTPVLTRRGWELLGELPLMGRIAAGRGLEAVPLEDEVYSLYEELVFSRSGRRRYLLRVAGQSMVGARIEDEDLLVVEQDEEPPEGAIVVALLRGGEEVTVKRVYREGRMVRLKPQNGEHRDILVPAAEVELQGRVVYVLHPPGDTLGNLPGR